MNAHPTSANAMRIVTDDSGDFCVVVGGRDGVVVTGDAVWGVVIGAGVVVVEGIFSIILNVVDPVTSITVPDTLTIYSSGLNVDASTSNDHWFIPPLPGSIVTVPDEPENSPLCDFCDGLNDEEVISTRSLFPTARLVEPVIANLSPTT